MKKNLGFIAVFIIAVYLLIGFAAWSLNPSTWDLIGRGTFATIIFIGIFCIILVEIETKNNNKDKPEAKYPKKADVFKELADPLIKFLNDNYNPHTTCIIDCVHAEIMSGEMAYRNEEFILD